ncbi:MAG: TDT family transporter [Brevinemataceae bacterium]
MNLLTMPIGFVASVMGSVTLSNIYGMMGYTWIRCLFHGLGVIATLMMLVKIVKFNAKCREEYNNMVLASLYPAFSMLIMLIGAFIFPIYPTVGKVLWLVGIIIHALFILIFTWKHVIRGFNYGTFVPTWFVTYFGILVSVVVGKPFNEPVITQVLTYYGLTALVLVYLPLIFRAVKDSIPEPLTHTRAIFLAPPALTLVSSLNTLPSNPLLITGLYVLLIGALIYTVVSIPKFFAVPFTPVFAGLTFPMAIGTLAGIKTSEFFSDKNELLSYFAFQISGFQLALTTVFIYFVLFQFFKVFVNEKKNLSS